MKQARLASESHSHGTTQAAACMCQQALTANALLQVSKVLSHHLLHMLLPLRCVVVLRYRQVSCCLAPVVQMAWSQELETPSKQVYLQRRWYANLVMYHYVITYCHVCMVQ